MSNSIPPDVEQFVADQISAGRYHSPDELAEAVRAAAVELIYRGRKLKQLQAEVEPALERLDRGEGRIADFEDIKRRGKERLAADLPER